MTIAEYNKIIPNHSVVQLLGDKKYIARGKYISEDCNYFIELGSGFNVNIDLLEIIPTMSATDEYFIEDRLKQEMEGNLYAEISLNYAGRDYVVRRDIYAVIGGKVASISEEKEPYFTGDTLLDLKTQCHHIGKYEPNNKIFFKAKTFTYQEINEVLGISSFDYP